METKKIQHERDIDRWLNEGGRDLDESRREPTMKLDVEAHITVRGDAMQYLGHDNAASWRGE